MSDRRHRRTLAAALGITLAASPAASLANVAAAAPDPAQPGAAPAYADLTHIEFTATGPLSARLVSPGDGGASELSAAVVEIATGAGMGAALAVNGKPVAFSQIGKRTVNTKTGETRYFYYGVPLAEGPNRVDVVPLGAGGARGAATTSTVYGPGRPAKIVAAIDGKLRADGRTPALVRIYGTDRWGHAALPGALVKLTIVAGDARFQGMPRPGAAAGDRSGTTVGMAVAAGDPGAALAGTPLVTSPLAGGNVPLPPAPPVAADAPGGETAVANAAVPQSQSTPFPFASTGPYAVSSSRPQFGEVLNQHAIGDTDSPQSTIELPLGPGGTAVVRLIPGLRPGDMRFRAAYDDLAVEQAAYVAPYLRAPIVVGVATTGVGAVPGVPGQDPTVEDGANSRRGRIAIYGTGQVARTAQVTAAYDTANSRNQTSAYGGNQDDPQERGYQTYGDASTRRDDALSRDHLYARVDVNKSSAMWGEFQANTTGPAGGGYNQYVSGAKVEIAGNNVRGTAFQARNDVAYSRQVFSPAGLSTLGTLLHPDIVVASEVVDLVTLDRRTGATLSQAVLARNVDYTIDYASGQIRFINPPLPFDLNFNPQQVLVQYEYQGPGVSAQTTGGRLDAGFGAKQNVRIGAGYVNDATGAGNFSLFNQDLTAVTPGGSFSFVHESTQGASDAGADTLAGLALGGGSTPSGNAYRASLLSTLGQTRVAADFGTTSTGYNNPFGGIATNGLLDYRVAFSRRVDEHDGTLTASFDHEQNNIADGVSSQSNVALRLQKHVASRITVRAGLNVVSSNGVLASTNSSLVNQVNTVATAAPLTAATAAPASATTVAQAELGVEYRVAPAVGLSVDRISNLGGGENASTPAQTTAQVAVDVAHHGRVYVRQLYADTPTQSFAAATTGLTTASSAKRSTSVGIEQNVGNNTTVDSEYVVENTGNGSDVYSAMGGRERFDLGDHLKGDATVQHASAIGGGTGAFNLYGLSLAYAYANRFRATTRFSERTGDAHGYTLDVGAAGALSDDVAAFATAQNSSSAGFDTVDDRLSVAYRPSTNDRAVTIFGYERRDGDVSDLGVHSEILSLEELYRPDRKLEFAGRYAFKLDGDAYYPAASSLFGLRADQRFGNRFDVAAEVRYLVTHADAGADTTGFAVEAGYRFGNDLRFAAGYNFTGSPDPSLASAPTRRGVYATATSVIDRVFGWGKEEGP